MKRRAAGGLVMAALLAWLAPMCASDPSATPDGGGRDAAGGSAGDGATPDGGDASDWDPVWHLTEPRAWPAPPAVPMDCGPGCSLFFSAPVASTTYWAFTYSTEWVLHAMDRQPAVLLGRRFGAQETKVYGDSTRESLIQPYVFGKRVSYLRPRGTGAGDGQVEVMDLVTGETKVAYSYTPATAGKSNSVIRTALNSRYAFWFHDGVGIMSRELATGAVRLWHPGSWLCHDVCANEHELLCAEQGVMYRLDLDTGEFGFLDADGGALQVEGFCSPDRKQFAWIDYRDPPGAQSTYDFHRNGGEVYIRDLETKHTRRVTFDSPSSPRGHVYPAVAGDTVVWAETPDGALQNPEDINVLYYAADVLVRLDLATGRKCRLNEPDTAPSRLTGYKAIYGNHLIGLAVAPLPENTVHLVDFDMDSPDVTWTCEQVTIPP